MSHGYGGGSEAYLTSPNGDDPSRARRRTILATPQGPFVRLRDMDAEREGWVSREWLIEHLSARPPASVTVNGLEGWRPLIPILSALSLLPRSVLLTVPIHDFFAACASPHHLDVSHRYCGIPDTSVCAGCFGTVAGPYIREFGSVSEWRAAWSPVLVRADNVVAYSDVSARILARAFPSARSTPGEHTPHPRLREVHQTLTRSPFARIAVFGTLSIAKGADVLVEVAELAAARGLFAEWHIFGAYRGTRTLPSFRFHGRYTRDDMPALVEADEVIAAVLPSIVPETYSFVADELRSMGVPFAAFPLGAPFERLRDDPTCHFADAVTPEALLSATWAAVEAGWRKYGGEEPTQVAADTERTDTLPR